MSPWVLIYTQGVVDEDGKSPGVGIIDEIDDVLTDPVFAMVGEMAAVVVAGVVEAAVLDSIDISSKGIKFRK